MKIKFFLLFSTIILLLTGCILDPYKDSKYGKLVINAWFNEKTLGETRKKAENINEIVSTECEYLEKSKNNYVFKCKIKYKEQGETVIPLSKHSEINVYAVFIKEKEETYDYKVYNSKYTKEDKIWKQYDYLNY